MFNTGAFPETWKVASVLPFAKPGKDSTLPVSYRPISLLSLLSKIAEKLIANRIKAELIHKQTIPPEQFGFQSNCSTAHAIMHIKKDILKAINNKSYTTMVMLDIQKAFDTVWHDGLIYKMIKIGISPYLIKLVHSYIKKRSFVVNVNSMKT